LRKSPKSGAGRSDACGFKPGEYIGRVAGSGQTNPANQRPMNGPRYNGSARPYHDFAYTAALREDSRQLIEKSRELRARFGRFAKSPRI
jgi:hypothetical protein